MPRRTRRPHPERAASRYVAAQGTVHGHASAATGVTISVKLRPPDRDSAHRRVVGARARAASPNAGPLPWPKAESGVGKGENCWSCPIRAMVATCSGTACVVFDPAQAGRSEGPAAQSQSRAHPPGEHCRIGLGGAGRDDQNSPGDRLEDRRDTRPSFSMPNSVRAELTDMATS